jgi:hypothetical protein
MRAPIATAIAIAFGLIVLLGYFIPAETGIAGLDNMLIIRTWVVNWAVTLAGFATLVAILGLVGAHWRKLRARRNADRYSLFVLAGFLVTVVFGVLAYGFQGAAGVMAFQQVVTAVQVPVEASLMAVLAVVLTLASFRLFQRRRGILPVVFVISTLVYLLWNSGILAGQANLPFAGDFLAAMQYLPVAGGRGILLGIALGSLMAGLRILFGADRPYSG